MMDTINDDRRHFDLLLSVFRDTAGTVGEDCLRALVRGLGELLNAETTFIARALDHPVSRVRALAAWKDGKFRDAWDYDLVGNPCLLTYNGEPTFIPCDVGQQFPKKGDSGYQSYIGVPLKDTDGGIIGHIAVYASKTRSFDDFSVELARLCGLRAEAEVRRLIDQQIEQDELRRLRLSNDANDDLLALAGHELRSPLASVIFTLGAIRTGVFGDIPDAVANYVSGALDASEELLAMTNELLDEQRIASGGKDLVLERIVVAEAIRNSITPLGALAEQADVHIDMDGIDADMTIVADQSSLEKMFANLISNAIKFSPKDGTIHIELERRGEKTVVSVIDEGPGIAKDLHSKIFERFVRGPSADIPCLKGSGLGLSFARTVAVVHGGSLRVESEPGSGSCFIVELPASL
ncbi:MAG: GAF domain-containing sensor histidine kinase [Rhodospirillaceae bacterium]|nr:GAF domain-containing sensor histidine kinase [Rhodospirillaceae bacterium]